MLEKSKKTILLKNIKIFKDKIYLEIIYGEKKIIKNFLKLHKYYAKKYEHNKSFTKILNLKVKFKNLEKIKLNF